MIPAESALPPPRPIVLTPILIGLNVVVFAVMLAFGASPLNPSSQSLLTFGANFGAAVVLEGEWWRPFTAMFVHIGAVHLLVNMYSLWNVGSFVERLLGKPLFIASYLLTGLAGSFSTILWNPLSVSAGASGAILGLFGIVIGFTFRAREQLPPTTFQSLRGSIIASLGIMLLLGFTSANIDNAAHLGGLAVGVLAGVMATASALEVPGRRASWGSQLIVLATVVGLGVLAQTRVGNHPKVKWRLALARAQHALESNHPEDALEYAELAVSAKDDPAARLTRGTAHAALKHYPQAIEDLDAAMPGLERDAELARAVPQAKFLRGTTRMMAGDYEGAEVDLRAVVKGAPDEPTAHNNLAWVLVRLDKNLEEALEHANFAVEADENAAHLGTRCWVYMARAEPDLARPDCERSVKLKPDNLLDQGMLALINQDNAKALQLWEQAAKADPVDGRDVEPWLQRAR